MQISIHALREEGDAFFLAIAVPPFLISIHALREEGDFRPCRDRACAGAISIHALREEGDPRSCSASPRPWNFYPRPPRGGRRVEAVRDMLDGVFLSTPSARRATSRPSATLSPSYDFYPRPPRGGRQLYPGQPRQPDRFLSTPSARRATARREPLKGAANISIHALREEGDRKRGPCCRNRPISIHALREEGDMPSRCSLRSGFVNISIHALREEGDMYSARAPRTSRHFYPRPPRGGRPEQGEPRGLLR